MLSRLALRLAAVNALRGATIAGTKNVFDSRQDLIDTMDTSAPVPVLAVYTEDDTSEPYGSGKVRPGNTHVHLVVECIQVVTGIAEVTKPDGTVETIEQIGATITDQQQEMLLDLLTAQVVRRLSGRDTDDAAVLLSHVAMEIPEIRTLPERLPANGARPAMRTVRLRVKIPHDRWPTPTNPPATGLALLPEPLATVAAGLTDPSDLALITQLAALVAAPVALLPGEGIDLYVNLGTAAPTGPDDAEMHAALTSPSS